MLDTVPAVVESLLPAGSIRKGLSHAWTLPDGRVLRVRHKKTCMLVTLTGCEEEIRVEAKNWVRLEEVVGLVIQTAAVSSTLKEQTTGETQCDKHSK